jgi:type IV pilus assembly protein PilV
MTTALRSRRLRARRAGYTLVEVMMALAILGIGATGLAAIQKTVIIGNTSARSLVTANSVASTWVERLRTDALVWNTGLLSDTLWLQKATPGVTAWQVPASVTGRGSAMTDITGADLYGAVAGEAVGFCTHLRLTQLYPTMVRAEIRVFWDKQGGTVPCLPNQVATVPTNARYGFVYITTSIPQGIGG